MIGSSRLVTACVVKNKDSLYFRNLVREYIDNIGRHITQKDENGPRHLI